MWYFNFIILPLIHLLIYYDLKHIYCHSFSIQYKVICLQDQFLKDCTSKHVGPIVSYKGFNGILARKIILNSNNDGILSYIVGNTLHRDTAYRKKKYISDELSTVKGSSSSNYP